MNHRLWFLVRLTLFVFLSQCCLASGQDAKSVTVGMPGYLKQLILPGSELEVVPLDRKAPVIVRITEAFRHGTAFRYDIVFYGMEPGSFDIKKYLRRKDGSSTAELPAILVVITPTLPPGQVLPSDPQSRGAPALGGYRLVLIILGVLWVLGFALIVFWGRRRKQLGQLATRPMTFADRLQPLVQEAAAGTLSRERRAELERMLLSYWRHRLKLNDEKPEQAFAVLRQHAEAGPLIRQLEIWLHARSPDRNVDVTAILQPYQNLPL